MWGSYQSLSILSDNEPKSTWSGLTSFFDSVYILETREYSSISMLR